MDLDAVIRELRERREQVARKIAVLERSQRSPRGRKSMPAAERSEVSQRIKGLLPPAGLPVNNSMSRWFVIGSLIPILPAAPDICRPDRTFRGRRASQSG